MIDIDQQIKSLEQKLTRLSSIEVLRASASAENKTLSKAKTATSSAVAKEERIPVSVVKKRIFHRRAIAGRKGASIVIYAKPVNAVDVRPTRYAKGWRVAGQRHDGAFLAKIKSQSRHHIFKREGRARLPINKVVVDISATVQRVGMAVVEYHAKKEYPKILKREYSARLNGYVQRGR